jgi:hypothetical protein
VHRKPVTITFSSNGIGDAALYYRPGGRLRRERAKASRFERSHSMRKKETGIRIEKEARRRARAGIGMPPVGRLIPDKRRKAPKHKKPLQDSNRT